MVRVLTITVNLWPEPMALCSVLPFYTGSFSSQLLRLVEAKPPDLQT